MTLRDYQTEGLTAVKAKYASGLRRMLCKMATGLGKTPFFAALPDFMGFGGRVMVVDHRTELTDQAVDKLQKWNPGRAVGVEMGDRRSNGEQLIVAGNATIGRAGSPRLLQFNPNDFDALVIDEAHHATAQSYQTVINHFTQNKRLLVLGVTATPNRADGDGLGKVFDEIVFDRDILFGVSKGWLSEPRGIRISTGIDLDYVRTVAGDFDQGELGSAVNTPERNDQIARAWLEHAKGRQTVIFSVNVQHAKDIATAFGNYGVGAQAIWGNDPDRARKLRGHRACEFPIIVNCGILTEGYDDWRIRCIGVAKPTKSEGLYTQIVGRGTRIQDNIDNLVEARKRGDPIAKDDCIILDFVDATSRHSLVTLATLFGMGQKTNLNGKKLTEVVAEINNAKQRNPALDLTKVEDIDKLKIYAQQVDLFKVSFPPEIIQISNLQWQKSGDNAYGVALLNRETVVVLKDILDKWHIKGVVNGYSVNKVMPSLVEAIQEADYQVGLLGGRGLLTLATRAEFRPKVSPTEPQLKLCRRLGINVPPDSTKAEVAERLTKFFSDRGQTRVQRRVA